MKKTIKSNILAFIIGAVLFGFIGSAFATSIASSSVSYTTLENNNVATVEDAINDLYGMVNIGCFNAICGKISYRYWNNNYAGSTGANLFDSTHMPATTYKTRALLEQNYANFGDEPIYIRSVLIDGNVVGHQVCLWTNSKEFCSSPGYWAGTLGTADQVVGANTIIKLEREMISTLGLNSSDISCTSTADDASCSVGDYDYDSYSSGSVGCYSNETDGYCGVNSSGAARCNR